MKKKIFISIPISKKNYKEQRAHADRVQQALSRRGWDVVNPFNIYCGTNAGRYDIISARLLALSQCTAIYLCKGYYMDRACMHEKNFTDIEAAFGKIYQEIRETSN